MPADWYAFLISHHSMLWMPIAWATQPTLPTRPPFPRGPISRELPTKFFSSTTSWSIWLEASKSIPSLLLGSSTRDLYAPNTFTPPRDLFESGWQTHGFHWKLVQKMGEFSLIKIDFMSILSLFLISRIRQLWMSVSTMEMTCPRNRYPKLIGMISKNPLLVLWFPTFSSPTLCKRYPMATSVTLNQGKTCSFGHWIWSMGQHCQQCHQETGQHP